MYLILAIVLAILGVVMIFGSAALAVNKYFLNGEVGTTKEKKVETNTIDSKLDTDKDGITDIKEIEEYGTNPNSADTDNDGYSDKTEIDGGYDPLTPAQ